MTEGLPPLLGLTAFEAAARRGSFAEAGRELHLSSSAVSHRVKVLERHLGATLFERGARSLRMTGRGQAYLPVVQATLDGLQQATLGVFGPRADAHVTVRAPVSYGLRVLIPRLPAMQQECGVQVEIVSSIWGPGGVDIEADVTIEHEVDVADPLDHAGVAVLVCAPDPPAQALRRIEVLGFEDLWADPALSTSGERIATAASARVDTWAAALSLVESPHGFCALVPDLIAADAVADGTVRVVPPTIEMRQRFGLRRRPAIGTDDAVDRVVGWLAGLHHRQRGRGGA